MKPATAKKSAEPVSIPMAALVGFMAGVLFATVRHFSHNHAGYTPTALVEHFVPYLIATVTVSALVFALAATILNRLMRKQ
jgi:uncharacterized membrane protein